MKVLIQFYALVCSFALTLSGCAVSNNIYFNDATPMTKRGTEAHVAVGTGMAPYIDSIGTTSDTIYFSNRYVTLPIIAAGARYGLSAKTDLRADIKLLGGFGFRVGLQHSFFDSGSKFNLALSADGACNFAAKAAFDIPVDNKNADYQVNADVFMPVSYQVNNNLQIIVTPRFTTGSFFVRDYVSDEKIQPYSYWAPVATVGVKYRQFYFEASGIYYHNGIIPVAGVGVSKYVAPSPHRKHKDKHHTKED